MNAKNIILAILMLLSFTACTSEIDGIDNGTTNVSVSNGETSISVRMMTEGIGTKSGAGEELAINNYVIAVFEDATGDRIGYATGSGASGADLQGVKLTIAAKEGKVNVVAVANVDENSFKNLYTYKEFGDCLVKDNLNDLTKVGVTPLTLKKNDNNQINITLNQLTVRVQVNLITKETHEGTMNNDVKIDFTAQSYTNKIATSSTILNPETSEVNAENRKGQDSNCTLNDQASFSYDTYAVTNPTLTVNTHLEVTVDGKTAMDKTYSTPVTFKENGNVLDYLKSGNIYTLEIVANVKLNISQVVEANLTYEVAEISEINNEVTFD